jgi:hypothetical protein
MITASTMPNAGTNPTFLYVIPRTAILGAILLTGYLGGAVPTQFRVSAVLFDIIFPAILGGLLWVASGCGFDACRRSFRFWRNSP